jgi:uncharacterized protein YlxW (UPF0749 family)
MNRSSKITLTVVSFLLGLLLVTQFHTQRQLAASAYAQSPADQAVIIGGLVDGNAALRKEVADLEDSLARAASSSDQGSMESMVADLNRLRVVNGLVEVAGPGVEVRISNGVTALDLQDLVNEARNAGAEALALNGRRLVARSVIVGSEGTIQMDGEVLRSPYRLQAIGHAESLERALDRKGGLVALLRYTYPDATITLSRQDRIVLPLYTGKYEFRYAH